MFDGELYLWTKPAIAPMPLWPRFLRHVFLSSYELDNEPPNRSKGSYWYCWGGAYTSETWFGNFVMKEEANLEVARQISRPHDPLDTAGIPGGWAEHGTCFQVANRILYATASEEKPPSVVPTSVPGCRLAYVGWGYYGEDHDGGVEWAAKRELADRIRSLVAV